MQAKLSVNSFWGILATLLFLLGGGQPSLAQGKGPSLVWVRPPAKPRTIVTSRTHIQRQGATLGGGDTPLNFQCALRMKGKDGRPVFVPFDYRFRPGDLIQLVVTANQDASLFIFEEEKSSLLFPVPSINQGKAEVKKHQPLTIPSACDPEKTDEQGQCYFAVADSGASLTLIMRRTADIETMSRDADWLTGLVRISPDELNQIAGNLSRDYQKKHIPQMEAVLFSSADPKRKDGLIVETKIHFAPAESAQVEAGENGSQQPVVISASKKAKSRWALK